jgi:hypothetical protein
MRDAIVAGAVRTPIGRPGGGSAGLEDPLRGAGMAAAFETVATSGYRMMRVRRA